MIRIQLDNNRGVWCAVPTIFCSYLGMGTTRVPRELLGAEDGHMKMGAASFGSSTPIPVSLQVHPESSCHYSLSLPKSSLLSLPFSFPKNSHQTLTSLTTAALFLHIGPGSKLAHMNPVKLWLVIFR